MVRYGKLRILCLYDTAVKNGSITSMSALQVSDRPRLPNVVYGNAFTTVGNKYYVTFIVVRGKNHPTAGVVDVTPYSPASTPIYTLEGSAYGQVSYVV